MKKYMIMCMAVVALLFASCKNEDISISREVSFEVNPYTVIRDFTFDPMDWMNELPSDGKLRVRLLVYDTNGDLVQSKEQQLSRYDEKMNVCLQLANGLYTAIVITDIVRNNNNVPEYWTLDGENKLSSMKIFNAGYISRLNMLGIAKQQFFVESGSSNSYSIDVKPAGTLMVSIVKGIHKYDGLGIQYYQLVTNKTCESCSFNNEGEWNSNVAAAINIRMSVLYPEDWNNTGYFYDFELPLGQTSLKWQADGTIDVTDALSVDMKAGEEYASVLDLEEGIFYCVLANGEKGFASLGFECAAPIKALKDNSKRVEMKRAEKDIQGIEIMKLLEMQ